MALEIMPRSHVIAGGSKLMIFKVMTKAWRDGYQDLDMLNRFSER
jgi:hypothetical protein